MQEVWPTKIDFGWPTAEIDRKMANSRMLIQYSVVEYKNYWFLGIILGRSLIKEICICNMTKNFIGHCTSSAVEFGNVLSHLKLGTKTFEIIAIYSPTLLLETTNTMTTTHNYRHTHSVG